MTNPSTWAAACARPVMVPPSGSGVLAASSQSRDLVGYVPESGRERLSGIDLQAWHVLGMFPAVQTNAQVKGAAKRPETGPYPWRPPE
jgi:hypothetical protein